MTYHGLRLAAGILVEGDHVTGVWSDVRSRWDAESWWVKSRIIFPAPNGEPIAEIHCTDGRVRHYTATTICRVVVDRSAQ